MTNRLVDIGMGAEGSKPRPVTSSLNVAGVHLITLSARWQLKLHPKRRSSLRTSAKLPFKYRKRIRRQPRNRVHEPSRAKAEHGINDGARDRGKDPSNVA